MFPQLRERLRTAADLLVEFSTLGEYRLGDPVTGVAEATAAPRGALSFEPGWEDPGARARGVPVRDLHGGASASPERASVAGRIESGRLAPPATPSGRRREPSRSAPGRRAAARKRGGSVPAPAQPCLARR